MSPASGLAPAAFFSSNPRWARAPQKWVTEECQHLSLEGDTFTQGKLGGQCLCFAVPGAVRPASHHSNCGTELPLRTKRAMKELKIAGFQLLAGNFQMWAAMAVCKGTFEFRVWIFSLNVSLWPASWGRKDIINHLNESWIFAPTFFHRSWLLGTRGWGTLFMISLWAVIPCPSCKMAASSLSSSCL